MVALSDSTTITISVVGFFAFLAIVVLARSLLVRKEATWKRIRLGFFIERDPSGDPTGADEEETEITPRK